MRLFKAPYPKDITESRILKITKPGARKRYGMVQVFMLLTPEMIGLFQHRGLIGKWHRTHLVHDLSLERKHSRTLRMGYRDPATNEMVWAQEDEISPPNIPRSPDNPLVSVPIEIESSLGIDYWDSRARGWEEHASAPIAYVKRGRYWCFAEHVAWTHGSKGIVRDIEMIADGSYRGRTDDWWMLCHLLAALNEYWD